MAILDAFLTQYRKEFDYFQEASRLCAQICESSLAQNGIRSIVTHRAKRPDRLKEKVVGRNEKEKYSSLQAIYDNIVDLSGVRVALYFPGEIEKVEELLYEKFDVRKSKLFPDRETKPAYEKRFSGYTARHYRVNLKIEELQEDSKRYSDAQIEIQVASVLMHAWAEVEHDLVYKPLSGKLSEDEYAILDELNGLVMAGEIALERLQRAGQFRIQDQEGRFNNHYELASYIYGKFIGST